MPRFTQAGVARRRVSFPIGLLVVGIALCLLGGTFRGAGAPLPGLLTPEETAWLAKHPDIRLAPTPDYQPVESFDASGKYVGITADYFRIIERRLDYHFKLVRPTPAQWQELDPDKRGADVITASASTPKREQYWTYTSIYLELPTYVITRSKAEDDLTLARLEGSRVAVVRGWAAEEYLRREHPKLVIEPVADAAEGLRKVSFGLVDAFVSELPVATAWMEAEGITNLKASTEAGYTYQLGISVRKDWPELRSILDKALATIKPEQRRQIFDRWVRLKTPAERRLEAFRRRLGWWVGGALLLFLGGALWNRSLVWRVRTRTRELGLSEEKFSKAFRSSPLAIAVTTMAEGKFLEVNDAFLAMHGFRSAADVIGRTSLELGMWTEPGERELLATRLRTERRLLNLKRPFRQPSGEIGTGLYSLEMIELAGQPCVLLLVNDVTERERAEAALRENELRLRLMAELIDGYSFAYTVLPGNKLKLDWLSQAGEKVLGYTEAELKGGVSFRECIHPDDRPAQQAALEAVMAGIPEVMEFRFRTKSGQTRWLQCFNRPEWNAEGTKVVRIVGAGQDISERRSSEQALRDSLEKTPNVCVQWFDESGAILYWNHASQLVYGWSPAESLRKTLGQLMFTPAQETAFLGLIQEIKATGKTIGPMEFPFTRKDGRKGVCLSTVFAIPAPDGAQIYVCTDIDLTDLRRAEADRDRLVAQLHLAEDAERRRIGRELHDSTAQQLAALKLSLVQLQKNSPATSPALAESIALTESAIQEIRNFTLLLHPPLLDELGLARALTDYGAGFGKRSGIQTVVETGNFSGRLAPATELALFRVGQEALTNILRHAESRTALIRLDRDEDEVRLEIQDAGHGMDLDKIQTGVGIAGMRERMRLVGGTLEVESDAEGTTIFATVPLKTNVAPVYDISIRFVD